MSAMRKCLAAVLLVVAACGGPATEESTTTTSTTLVTTTTSTTTSTSTTSTSTSTTTTTTPATSTTSGSVSGNWADEPLIVAPWGAVGWWAGSGWVGSFGSLPVSGGEDYQVVSMFGSGLVTGGPQTELCEPLQLLGVELSDPAKLGDWPGPFGVAISAPWDIRPNLYQEFTDDGTYAGYARDLLASRGLVVAEPVIKQLIRFDLEGDGVNEILVVAEDMGPNLIEAEIGDYSIAFLRKVVDGEVQTAIFGASVHAVAGEMANMFGIGGVGDLNGDGKMEVVTSGQYYEGAWIEIWEWVDDDIGISVQLSQGCGA